MDRQVEESLSFIRAHRRRYPAPHPIVKWNCRNVLSITVSRLIIVMEMEVVKEGQVPNG